MRPGISTNSSVLEVRAPSGSRPFLTFTRTLLHFYPVAVQRVSPRTPGRSRGCHFLNHNTVLNGNQFQLAQYSPSYYRATWIATGLDAGFATAMAIRPKWLRDMCSILFSAYYIIYANEADEKVWRCFGLAIEI